MQGLFTNTPNTLVCEGRRAWGAETAQDSYPSKPVYPKLPAKVIRGPALKKSKTLIELIRSCQVIATSGEGGFQAPVHYHLAWYSNELNHPYFTIPFYLHCKTLHDKISVYYFLIH